MSFTPTPVFYVFIGLLIGMVIGWVIGFFDSNSRASKKIEDAEANAELKLREAEKKIAQAGQKFADPSQPVQYDQDDPGLLRLKKDDGRMTLEMDGALINGELSPDRKKRLIELLTVLRPWIEGGQPAAQPQTLLAPDPARDAVSRSVQQSPIQPLPSAKKSEAEKNIASLSIVQQIDTVLQERLLDSPLAKRGIRLQESIQGGVEVYVGLQKFFSVDEVPDDTIKTAIRAAIAEWEKKYTPGM